MMLALEILAAPECFLQQRPPGYPLPRTASGVPFWMINLALIHTVPGWRDWQAKRDMAQIIPVIEAARANLPTGASA